MPKSVNYDYDTCFRPLKDYIFLYYMFSGKCANYANTEHEGEYL